MRACNGMHLPNAKFWHIEQMQRAVGSDGAITCLHPQLVNDPLIGSHADGENEHWYLKLREGFAPQGSPPAPERFIHIRCYHPFSLSVDPRAYAEHMVNLLANWQGSGSTASRTVNLWYDPFVGISSMNETNLHSENGDDNANNQPQYQTVAHYDRIMAWDMAFWQRVDELVPDRKALRVFPALAYGHEPPNLEPGGEYTLPSVRACLAASDILASHPYAHLDWVDGAKTAPGGADQYWHMLCDFRPKGFKNVSDPGGLYVQVKNKPFILTESGTFTHSNKGRTADTWKAMTDLLKVAQATGRCLGITWFIWSSNGSHPDNEIWPNEDLRGLLETAPRYTSAAVVPIRGEVPPPTTTRPPLPIPTTTPAPIPPITTTKPPEVPMPVFNPNPLNYNVGAGFVTRAAELGWTLLSDEIYHDPSHREAPRTAFSEAFCDKGRLYWHTRTGVVAVPFAEGEL